MTKKDNSARAYNRKEGKINSWFENDFPPELLIECLRDIEEFLLAFGANIFVRINRLRRAAIDMETIKWLQVFCEQYYDESLIIAFDVSISESNPLFSISFARKNPDLTTPEKWESSRTILLDGTAYPEAAKSLFGKDFKIISGSADLESNNCVFFEKRITSSYRKKILKNPSLSMKALKRIRRMIEPTASKILIISYMNIEEQIKIQMQELKPHAEVSSIHFNESRGLNSYQDFDVVIVFGNYIGNIGAREMEGRCLFGSENENDRIAEFRNHMDMAETAQAIQRIRLVNGNKQLFMIGSDFPSKFIPLQYDRIDSGDRNFSNSETNIDLAIKRIAPWIEKGYPIDKWILRLFGICSESELKFMHSFQRYLSIAPLNKAWNLRLLECFSNNRNALGHNRQVVYTGYETGGGFSGKNCSFMPTIYNSHKRTKNSPKTDPSLITSENNLLSQNSESYLENMLLQSRRLENDSRLSGDENRVGLIMFSKRNRSKHTEWTSELQFIIRDEYPDYQEYEIGENIPGSEFRGIGNGEEAVEVLNQFGIRPLRGGIWKWRQL